MFSTLLLLVLSSCKFQAESSFTGDAARYGESSAGDGSPAAQIYVKVNKIIRSECASCHADYVQYTMDKWVSYNMVVAGSPDTSVLMRRLRNSGVSGQNDMPRIGALSAEEISTIREWIVLLGEGGTATSPAQERFDAARAVIQQYCRPCHTSARTGTSAPFNGVAVGLFANYTNQNQFVAAALVVPGNASSSWLFRALRNAGDLDKMPPLAAPQPEASDLEAIETWIDQMTEE